MKVEISIGLGFLGFFLMLASCQAHNREEEIACIQKGLTPDQCEEYNKSIQD
jgi:hypothetical protein